MMYIAMNHVALCSELKIIGDNLKIVGEREKKSLSSVSKNDFFTHWRKRNLFLRRESSMELFMCNPPYFAQFLAKNFAGTELEFKATKIHPAQLIQ